MPAGQGGWILGRSGALPHGKNLGVPAGLASPLESRSEDKAPGSGAAMGFG